MGVVSTPCRVLTIIALTARPMDRLRSVSQSTDFKEIERIHFSSRRAQAHPCSHPGDHAIVVQIGRNAMTTLLGHTLAHAFANTLTLSAQSALCALFSSARQTPPNGYVALFCGSQALGLMPPRHAKGLNSVLDHCTLHEHALVWNALHQTPSHRSAQLQAALVQLRDQGHIRGWRNEAFCYWPESHTSPDTQQPAFLQIERAGFRFLGMMSHAVHINGFTPDARMWCGQRSAGKATDPGMWDNVTAGGLSAGETLARCARRELWEEAGYRLPAPQQLTPAGRVRISRATPSGWHDEMLHVFNLALPADFVPCNQDGEVQSFACLSAPEVMAQIVAGQFTADAALAIAQGVLATNPP